MSDFELDAPVDAVLCLFGSIGYLEPEAALPGALRAFHRALMPGGVVLVEPWLEPAAVLDRRPHLQTYHSDELHLARANTMVLEGRVTTLDFHWLVASKGGVEHFTELHRLWCSTREELLATFDATGFDARWEPGLRPNGRGTIIGRRRG